MFRPYRYGNDSSASKMKRFMLDTMIFDRFDADPARLRSAHQMAMAGLLEFVVTHIQLDQLNAIPEAGKRTRLRAVAALLAIELPTRGAVVGPGGGRVGFDAIVGPRIVGSRYPEVAGPNRRHDADAVIGALSADQVEVLVTEDRRLYNRVSALGTGIELLTWHEFCLRLDAVSAGQARSP
jgi:hypothetical protein